MEDLKTLEEKLLEGSKKWEDIPPKSVSSSLDAIRILEPAIRKMLEKRYTLKEISTKLLEDFQISITTGTLSTYLKRFESERKKSLSAAKRETAKLAKIAANTQNKLAEEKLAEIAETEENITNKETTLVESRSVDNAKSQKDENLTIDSVVPKVNSTDGVNIINASQTEKLTFADKNLTQKSVVPKKFPVKDNEEVDLAEKERLEEEKLAKYYNKY